MARPHRARATRLREQLVAKYQGDMHAYSEACVRHTKALGFTFKTLDSVKEALATP